MTRHRHTSNPAAARLGCSPPEVEIPGRTHALGAGQHRCIRMLDVGLGWVKIWGSADGGWRGRVGVLGILPEAWVSRGSVCWEPGGWTTAAQVPVEEETGGLCLREKRKTFARKGAMQPDVHRQAVHAADGPAGDEDAPHSVMYTRDAPISPKERAWRAAAAG